MVLGLQDLSCVDLLALSSLFVLELSKSYPEHKACVLRERLPVEVTGDVGRPLFLNEEPLYIWKKVSY